MLEKHIRKNPNTGEIEISLINDKSQDWTVKMSEEEFNYYWKIVSMVQMGDGYAK